VASARRESIATRGISDPWQRGHRYGKGETRVRRTGADANAPSMPVKFRMTGCWMSIILSVVLTILLNLILRGCNTF
jgi:hypothetical protein